MDTTGLRLDLIIRTSKRKKEARSPQQQRDIADACIAANGYRLGRVHDSGTSESGKTMDRASIHAAMERVRAGETDGIIVALLDRIGRAPIEEAMTFVRALDSVGVLVIADTGGEPVDLRNPNSETMLVMQLQFARQQWVAAAERFKRSQRDAIAAGKHVGPTPIGYRRAKGRLYPGARGPVITEAYRVAARSGQHAAMDYLRGAVPGRRWDSDHVRKLLANRVYLGESRTGALVNVKAHEPLTTPATWLAAQTTPRHRYANGEYPLTGLAECECGSPMVGAHQSVGSRRYRRMRCSDVACPSGGCTINADKLEAFVRERLAENLDRLSFRALLDPKGRQGIEDGLAAAEYDLEQFADAVAGKSGDFIRRNLDKRQAAVDGWMERLRAVVEAEAQSETLPSAAELGDPGKLRVAVSSRAVVGLVVRRGSKSRVVDARRVDLQLIDDDDDGARALSA